MLRQNLFDIRLDAQAARFGTLGDLIGYFERNLHANNVSRIAGDGFGAGEGGFESETQCDRTG